MKEYNLLGEAETIDWLGAEWLPGRRRTAVQSVLAMPRIVLFDDDPLFSRAMELAARRVGVPLLAIANGQDVAKAENFECDVAVLDFDLGDTSGIEVAEVLRERIGAVPMLIVSYKDRRASANDPWPLPIKRFVRKDLGSSTILERAIEVYNMYAGGSWRRRRTTSRSK